jgi:hypothetical protein
MNKKYNLSNKKKKGITMKKPRIIFTALILVMLIVAAMPAVSLAVTGNGDCPDGYNFVARYAWASGQYTFDDGQNVFTFSSHSVTGGGPDATEGHWDSGTVGINAVVLKDGNEPQGGPTIFDYYYYDPSVTSDDFTNDNLTDQTGKERDISHIDFCALPTQPGTIIVEKQTDPDGAPDSFTFSGDAAGTIADGGQIVVNDLQPGTYTSQETGLPSGWELTAIQCDDGNSSGDVNTHTATFQLEAGETVKCTFYNAELPPQTGTIISAQAGADGVTLAWETGTEIDNAGFNLYRATSADGSYTKVNDALIAAQGDPVSGASYSFADAPGYGTFYYKLEDVDLHGTSTLHGPVKVTVARPLRRPLYRPTLPRF